MIVEFFVIQENEKQERRDMFLGNKEVKFLTNGSYYNFNNETFVVQRQEIIHKIVHAYCYQNTEFINETHTEETEFGDANF